MELFDLLIAKQLSGAGGDLPFGETKEVVEVPLSITFDGDATGKEAVTIMGAPMVKMSDMVLSKDDLTGATGVLQIGEEEISIILSADDGSLMDVTGDGIPVIGNPEFVISVLSDFSHEEATGGAVIPAGLYFLCTVNEAYTKSFIAPNVTVKQEQTTITPLPAKYLPEGMGYIEEGGMVEILPETTLTSPEEEPGEFLLTENLPVLTVGERYIVTWNGVEYGGTAVDGSEMLGAGSVIVANDGADIQTGDGAVFIVTYTLDAGNGQPSLYVLDFASSTTVTLSIKGEDVTIHKLDNRCLDLAWLPTIVDGAEMVLSTRTVTTQLTTTTEFVWAGDCVGKTYIVEYGGERYECVCRSYSDGERGANYIGNMNIEGNYPNTDTGEPFLVQQLFGVPDIPENLTYIVKSGPSAEITVYGPGYNKMPDGFLPDGLFVDGAESFVLTSAEDANGIRHKYRISVNGSGQLVTTKVTE